MAAAVKEHGVDGAVELFRLPYGPRGTGAGGNGAGVGEGAKRKAEGDPAPMETATSGANRLGFLDDHLAAVAAALDAQHDVEVGALTLDADLSGIFRRSRSIDLDGTLSLGHYEVLADLFG